jgi:competence protein ComEA
VYVLHVGEAAPPPVAGSAGAGGSGPASGGAASGPIDLNTADEAALDGLPGIGPTTAAAIVEHRTRIGRFTSVDQLLDVRGIGEAKLDAIRDLVRV